jgi:phage tail-like protein
MRIIPPSGTVMMRGRAQWLRCAFDGTTLLDDVVTLAAAKPPASALPAVAPAAWAGLAFDTHCRLFHALPDAAALEYVLWGATSQLGVHDATRHPLVVTGPETEDNGEPLPTADLPLRTEALAVGANDLLYVSDPLRQAVWLIDTWKQEVQRRIDFFHAPLDLAECGGVVFALLADGSTWQLSACDAPSRTPWPAITGAQRLSVSQSSTGGRLAWVLTQSGSSQAALWALHLDQPKPYTVPDARDVLSGADDANFGTLLVVPMRAGDEFVRLRWLGTQPALQPGLSAPYYDGSGITWAPDGRVAYWSEQGLRHAAPARAHYQTTGLLTGHALDSGLDQTTWGRVLLQACVPAGTSLKLWAFTSDEIDHPDPITRTAPAGQALSPLPPGTETQTPLLSQRAWDQHAEQAQSLYRDDSQRPLSEAPPEGMAWFEAPVIAGPGRYLWLVFEFKGTHSKSPRLHSARIEYPGHQWLQQLPRTLWREAPARDFLQRFLMPMAAMLDEMEGVSSERHRLLDARITPGQALPWLASFMGLALDPCWSEAVQRRMVREAAKLFRTRGTLASLQRMVEILTNDAEVIILEHFRLRGGGVAGNAASQTSQAVLGVGFRVGGLIGEPQDLPMADAGPVDFDQFAHRFTVTVVASLDASQLACVKRLIELHKPAHTDFDLCTAQSGIRVGLGSHVGISAVVGASAGFQPAITGSAALGEGFVLGGRP